MAAIEIIELVKRYGATQVLHGLNLDIEPGEFVVLVGPSGCGKSTLLRMIAGLEAVSDGIIAIDGKPVNHTSPKDRDIAMVFQSYALYPHFNVRRNLAFGLELGRVDRSEIDRRVTAVAATLGLSEMLDRKPRQLSGGQRQRVAMGRAMVREPKVFLFDEPLSNLDAKLRVQMRTEIKELHQQLGRTTVYVTHDQIEAMTMADRIVVMRGGHIEQAGTPMNVFDAPVTEFVAGFIGSPTMNVMDGSIEHETDCSVVRLKNGWRMPLGGRAGLPAGARVRYGIRPHDLHPSEAGDALAWRADVVEPSGSEVQVVTHLDGMTLSAVLPGRQRITPGQVLRLAPDPQTAHVFDPNTGARLAVAATKDTQSRSRVVKAG
ncbi:MULTISPECIES: sn-glycerol-3-phosphate ABC transporter ATP-binding protein UgpC [unclassified Roseitalea]|uniref:ABC transporter ATP-binding protein n=1 Tax=unclassified Roseitalea TaxID=2639107 RepID=UPI00273F6793|nr:MULTISPECIES: sn-glycerol-3-phosphate ABC transporter ATP-binding protein UgpC [unclassified Roseitalea]